MRKNIGIMGPDGNPIQQSPDFNLAMSQEVADILDEKCERVNQLEKYCEELRARCEDMKKQYEEDVDVLKGMVREFREENIRLRKLLEENGG